MFKTQIEIGIPNELPMHPGIDPTVPHAPKRIIDTILNTDEKVSDTQ